jgi:putative ABC transport system permease protein
MALGARVRDVVQMVLGRGAALLAAGIAVGLAASFATVRVLANQVFRLSTFDPLSFAAVSLLLFAAGMFACFVPARRAAQVDPATALRDE